MRQIIGIAGAALIAALVPAIYFGVPDQSLRGGLLAFVFASVWVVLLGLPTFFLFKRYGWVRWWSASIAGFILGLVPMALVSWPYHPGVDSGYSAWDGQRMVAYVVHGIPTPAGWVQYLNSSCGVGLLGAASAVMFWVAWRLVVGPNQSSKRTREKPRAA